MADISIEKGSDKDAVIITGDMSIQDAAAIRDALIQSLENATHVALDLKDTTAIDLSCIQLLCSVHRTSIHSGKSLELKPGCQEILKEAVTEAMYASRFGCTSETEKTCLWKGM